MTSMQSVDARTGRLVGAAWPGTTAAQIRTAAEAAGHDAARFAAAPIEVRATLLDALANALEDQRTELVELADRETALGATRLQGELDRTAFQLRGFAQATRSGNAGDHLDDAAISGPPPAGRPRLTRLRVPVGPVAVFAASNFPFAFSVLGGDTAAALAAGCPVIVKCHPAHPELSRQTAALAHRTIAALGLPDGVFQTVEGADVETGRRLVEEPAIAAVAFTGSFQGGTALARIAAERPRPIPFYGELGSVNPVIVLPSALDGDTAPLAHALANSICSGTGQFCTSPGLVVLPQGKIGDAFVEQLADSLRRATLHPMLTAGIREGFDRGVARFAAHANVQPRVHVPTAPEVPPHPYLGEVMASDLVADPQLHAEVFGPSALVVRTRSMADVIAVLDAVGGSLTVTLWGAGEDTPAHRDLVRAAVRVAGRVLFSGVPTGVAVTAAQHHGGPYPASTAPATTSVGYAAMERFLRPVALQDIPDWLDNAGALPC